MPDELVDVVDEQDNVIGQALRTRARRDKLGHRAVHVFVVRSDGKLLMQLRPPTVSLFPSHYGGSATGHVGAGETYDDAAVRETEEEIGVRLNLERFCHDRVVSSVDGAWMWVCGYAARYDGPVQPDPKEVVRIEERAPEEVRRTAEEGPVMPHAKYLLEKYWDRIFQNNER